MTRKFHFSPLFTLLTITLVAVMAGLGMWQLDRAALKRDKIAAFERHDSQPAVLAGNNAKQSTMGIAARVTSQERYARVSITGHYIADRQVVMDGLSRKQQPGFHVLTAFQPQGSEQLLMVNRGWRAWQGRREQIDGLEVANTRRTITGRIDQFWQAGMVLGQGNAEEASSWPRLAVYPQANEIASWLDADVIPRIVLLDDDQSDGFIREWRPGGLTPERHIGYAFQWFALALTLFIIYLVMSFKRETSIMDTTNE